ncbi:hypothetical protein DM867_05885 [Halosegnis rubeus]|uniref:Uncharacterized protein n=1 Tax=Halosegnis rubeus TaxID=2212850 RepID=A0A5N5U811_9EURY|nr:hypothetical protein DM867_05885 [Halosegnis rubeus]
MSRSTARSTRTVSSLGTGVGVDVGVAVGVGVAVPSSVGVAVGVVVPLVVGVAVGVGDSGVDGAGPWPPSCVAPRPTTTASTTTATARRFLFTGGPRGGDRTGRATLPYSRRSPAHELKGLSLPAPVASTSIADAVDIRVCHSVAARFSRVLALPRAGARSPTASPRRPGCSRRLSVTRRHRRTKTTTTVWSEPSRTSFDSDGTTARRTISSSTRR